ncbi:MAG: hypothetical protein PUD25_03430 [Bacilli bacterium]|nr:hypothetical protein [Bacilli bacterium]
MIERLEEIFSELYIECINTNIVEKRKNLKNKLRKKQRHQKSN